MNTIHQAAGKLSWGITAIGGICLAATFLFISTSAVLQLLRQIDDAEDLLIAVIPIVCFSIGLAANIAVAIGAYTSGAWAGAAKGVGISSSFFLLWMMMTVEVFKGSRIEGLEYWAYWAMPCFWIGLPLMAFGGLAGAKASGARIPYPVLGFVGCLAFYLPGSLLLRTVAEAVREIFVILFSW